MRFERRLVLACGVIAAGGLGDHVLPAGFVHPAIKT